MTKVDFLIVGQGLAGSILALELLDRGKTVRIVDNEHEGAASNVAAGIINPITGDGLLKAGALTNFCHLPKRIIASWKNDSISRFSMIVLFFDS